MALLLRAVRKRRWDPSEAPWLTKGRMQADALGDLNTTEDTLFVYLVKKDKSNFNQIITALAATRDTLQNVDYALFDFQVLGSVSIEFKEVKGTTADVIVNSWHLDLIKLSPEKLLELAYAIFNHAEIGRFPKIQVIPLVVEAMKSGHLDQANLGDKVLKEVNKYLG